MKKLLLLFLTLFLLVVPVFAEGEDYIEIPSENTAQLEKLVGTAEEDGKMVLYFFRGEGCHFCENELKWIDYLYATYGDYFKVVIRESWTDSVNNQLLKEVKGLFGLEEDDAVPFNVFDGKAMIGISPNQALLIENEIRAVAGLEPREEATEYIDILYAEDVEPVVDDITVEPEVVEPVVSTSVSSQALNMLCVFGSFSLIALTAFLLSLTGYVLKKIDLLKK